MHWHLWSRAHVYRGCRTILPGRTVIGLGAFARTGHRLQRFEAWKLLIGRQRPCAFDWFWFVQSIHRRKPNKYRLWNCRIHGTWYETRTATIQQHIGALINQLFLSEILLELPYDKSVDYWTFGILMYEMLTGYVSRWSFNADVSSQILNWLHIDPFPMW